MRGGWGTLTKNVPQPSPQEIIHHPLHQSRRGGGGQGQDELGFGDGLVDKVRGLKDDGQMPFDFAGPAAGQQRYGEALRVQVMRGQEGFAVRQGRQGFPKGMAHVLHRHAALPVEVGLKGKDDHHAVGEAGDGPHPIGAPGPDLGADVVQHRHPPIFGQAGHPKVKVGKIHQDGQIRPLGFQGPADGRQRPPDRRQVFHHFQEAHHRQFRGVAEQTHPLPCQGLSAHAEKLRLRRRLPNSRHQPGRMVITRGFPGDDEDFGGLKPVGKREQISHNVSLTDRLASF